MNKIKFLLFCCLLTFAVSCGQQKKYIEYKVGAGETMRSIAKKLDIKTKYLRRLNPNIGRKPAVNTVIIVPNSKNRSKIISETKTVQDTAKDTMVVAADQVDIPKAELDSLNVKYLLHKVKKGDTFYNLTRFYNVSKEQLVALNPILSEGLKLLQEIKIKEHKETHLEDLIYNDVIKDSISLNLSLLLPFRAASFDTIAADDIFEKSRLADLVTDFYLGAELAIDSLKSQGVAVNLNVFDTGANGSKIKTILKEDNLAESDVIIGPLYSEEVALAANNLKVPFVFPFYSKKQSKFKASNIIKTAPEKQVLQDALVAHIKETYTQGTVTVVSDGEMASDTRALKIKEVLETEDSIAKVNVLKAKGYIEKDRFLEIFKPLTNNWVVLATNKNIVVLDAVNSLISLPDSISVKVFSIEKSASFDKIDNNKLAQVEFTYASDRFVDEGSMSTQIFNRQYVSKNNTLPSFYATKGFDITYDILMRLASGDALKTTFKNGASYRVESRFNYRNQPFKATENTGAFIIRYNKDLTLTRIK